MGLVRNLVVPLLLAATTTIVLIYPYVRRDSSVVDDYFGIKIADPYRWLEDPDSPETQKFVKEENELTEFYLSKVKSRESIRSRFTSVMNYAKSTAYEKNCGKYYTIENSGLQNQSVMYVRTSIDDPNPRVFLDPNKFSEDGTVALDTDSYAFSRNGQLFVYATSQSGSDWKHIYFMNASNGKMLEDVLKYTKWPSMSWTVDSLGVFYSRYPNPKLSNGSTSTVVEHEKIYYHKIGTTQDSDILIAEFPEAPQRFLLTQVSDCGDYLIITGQDSYKASLIHIISLKGGVPTKKNQLIPVYPNSKDAIYSYIAHRGSSFLFLTSKDAPNYKVISVTVDLHVPTGPSSNGGGGGGQVTLSSTFLKEHPKNTINWVLVIDTDKLLVCYMEDVKHTLELRSLKDSHLIHKFELPTGTITSFYREDEEDTEFFFRLENFLTPGIIYHCQVHPRVKCTIIKQLTAGNIDVNNFVMQQKFYPSKDGTLIPMYTLRKKNTVMDGSAPVLLYAYGGYGISMLPTFSATNLIFADNFNGIYALANIRGGGEYGEKWHMAGSVLNKQNVFDDFQAAAEYLIQKNYTHPSKLAIRGGSNGGLLIGACVNQRPELYGAAIAQVGVMDMLRFQKFTNGYAWCSEFGCSDNKTEFESLIKLSPLHNIRLPTNPNVQYPAVLVTTADHDDRVVPAHSYKYTAELQFTIGMSSRQTNPLLLRVDAKAGHGGGKPTSKQIDEMTDIFAFLSKTLDIKFT